MRKPKSSVKKKASTKRAPRAVENAVWLRAQPDGKEPKPPVQTRVGLLPFRELTWQNFERLCLRVSELEAKVEATWSYGKSGHAQHGIDVLVRMPDGAFHVWQSKRYQSISTTAIKQAVDLFLGRKWGQKASRFVLAVACNFESPAVVEAVEEARTLLQSKGITFEALDGFKLTGRLKSEPELIDDFFGRPWAQAVCSPEALTRLEQRLSRFEIVPLRCALRSCYSSWISTVDPGLPIVGQDDYGRTRASVPITDRYVQPDLLLQVPDSGSALMSGESDTRSSAAQTITSKEAAESGKRERDSLALNQQQSRPVVRERRIPLDDYLSSKTQSLIVGDAGSGKSSLLRFLALDILSDKPALKVSKEIYKGALPVWLPFALWARMSIDQGAPAPIEEVVAAFFRAQGAANLADQMRRAAHGKGIVLLVDGLDEALDPTAAQTLIAVLTTYVEQRNIPVVATSRPHGMRNINGLGGSWDRSQLAPLSDSQRHALATLWFRVLEGFEAGSSTTQTQIRAYAKRKADTFIAALPGNAGITRLSQTPLFLLAFMNLHRRGQNLPRSRFAASKEIVDQLMEHQPRRRDVSALTTLSSSGEGRLRDRVIADFAFALQSGDLSGSIPDAATEDQAVGRGATLILERQNSGDANAAEKVARAIFSFTEERAGLLVNKTPGNIGFLHLSLQEYLAARHLMQRTAPDKIAFVVAHAGLVRWREPILYLLFLTPAEAEVGELMEAIETAPLGDAEARSVRDALLTEAVFADFSHDLGVVRRLAARCFGEAELIAWGDRQRQLLTAVVDGLFSESVGEMCRAKLTEWVPDRHGYSRASAIKAIVQWDSSLKPACVPALLRCLRCENEYVWRPAAQILPAVADQSSDIKATLLRLAKEAPSVQTAQAAISSLGCGWPNDEDVGAIAASLRSSNHQGLCVDSIRILAKRSEADKDDLDRFFHIAYRQESFFPSLFARDLVEHFAAHQRMTFIEKLETTIAEQKDDRVNRVLPLIGSLFICDPSSALAHDGLLEVLSKDWVWHTVFTHGNFPVERIQWTSDLIAKVEERVKTKDQAFENEWYWISKVAPLPVLKQKFLEALRERKHLSFWCSRGLVEGWGKNDPEVKDIFASFLTAEPKAISEIAEELPLVIDDRKACREALLRGLRSDVSRYDFLLKGCKNLNIKADDEEVVVAALEAGKRKTSELYRDLWCKNIINTFPEHPDVHKIALDELMRRDGSLGEVAKNYPRDREMCQLVLGVLCPLEDSVRLPLVQSIGAAASSNAAALKLLAATQQDTNGLVCSESMIGFVECMLEHGPLPSNDLQRLEDELDAVGPEYQKRRVAAAIGLLLSGNIQCFVKAKDYNKKPLDVEINPDLTRDDLYLRRLLSRWGELKDALGGEEEILKRFDITPERTLGTLHAGMPNVDRLFALLMEKVPTAQHVNKNDLIEALAQIAPQSKHMRDLVASLLLKQNVPRSNAEYWAELRAGEFFAEYFIGDQDLRARVIDAVKAGPQNEAAVGALAELLLREDNASLEDILREKVSGVRYHLGTHYKLVAALSSPENFIEAIEELLTKDAEPQEWAMSYWVPTLLRRIKTDTELQDKIFSTFTKVESISMKVTLAALLLRGAARSDQIKQYAMGELQKVQENPIPSVGFDLTSYAHRPLFHLLTELAA
jgi:hypothetical protein